MEGACDHPSDGACVLLRQVLLLDPLLNLLLYLDRDNQFRKDDDVCLHGMGLL